MDILGNGENEQYGITPEIHLDDSVPRFDGATGGNLQTSSITIDDSDNLTTTGNIIVGGTVDGVDIATRDSLSVINIGITSTDNAIVRFRDTTGKSVQSSNVIIDDSSNITGINDLTATGSITTADVNAVQLNGDNDSIAIGYLALDSTSMATTSNVAIGDQALQQLTGASTDNVAIGAGANVSGVSKSQSTAIGSLARTGSYSNCTAIGYGASGTANNQVTLGDGIVSQIVPGADAVADLGSATTQFKDLYLSGDIIAGGTTTEQLKKYTTNSYSAGVNSKSSGDFAVSIGTNAGSNSTSSNTVFIGNNAGRYISSGVNAVAIGFGTLQGDTGTPTTGGRHTAIGTNCLKSVVGACEENTGMGSQTLMNVSTGNCNSGFGNDAGLSITTGAQNTFLGCDSNGSATLSNQTSLGFGATCDTANQITLGNSAVTQIVPGGATTDLGGSGTKQFKDLYLSGNIDGGSYTLNGVNMEPIKRHSTTSLYSGNSSKSSGATSISIGDYSGSASTSSANVFIGYDSARYPTSIIQSVAIGHSALKGDGVTALTATGNVAIGYNSLSIAKGAAGNNTCVGNASGDSITTGASNTCIGFNSDCVATGTNQSSLGVGATCDASNQIYLGNGSITSFKCQVALTIVSDERDKKNIEPMTGGLSLIDDIKTCKWQWKMRDLRKPKKDEEGSIIELEPYKAIEGKSCGFTVQGLKETMTKHGTIDDLIDESNPERMGIRESKLIPILVNAIQELSAQVKELQAKLP
jgi:hypothetical protein